MDAIHFPSGLSTAPLGRASQRAGVAPGFCGSIFQTPIPSPPGIRNIPSIMKKSPGRGGAVGRHNPALRPGAVVLLYFRRNREPHPVAIGRDLRVPDILDPVVVFNSESPAGSRRSSL